MNEEITMKTIRLTSRLAVLAAIAVLAAPTAQAAQATATASGTVVTPIAITVATNLNFGSFAAGPGGTITISTSGARTASGVIALGSGSNAAARFDITGSPSTTYSISHSGTAVLTNTTGVGAETMALAKHSDLSAADATSGNVSSGTLSGAGAQSLFVGATLTVAAAQVPGIYTGTVIATVEYN
jgi:spore coat protein U-like protein